MTRRRLVLGGAIGGAVLLLTGCGSDLGLPQPVTTQGTHTRDLWRVFVVIAFIIGAIVYLLIAFVVIRYRRNRSGGGEPSQRQYHVPIEIIYTAIPIVTISRTRPKSARIARPASTVATTAPPAVW